MVKHKVWYSGHNCKITRTLNLGELEVTNQHINIHQPKQLGFVDASALAITTTTSPDPITTTSAAIELLAVTTTPVLIEPLAVTTTSSA